MFSSLLYFRFHDGRDAVQSGLKLLRVTNTRPKNCGWIFIAKMHPTKVVVVRGQRRPIGSAGGWNSRWKLNRIHTAAGQ